MPNRDNTRQRQRALLLRVMREYDDTSTGIARRIGVSPSTLNRFLNKDGYEGTLSAVNEAAIKALEGKGRDKSSLFQIASPRAIVDSRRASETTAEIVPLARGVGRRALVPVLGVAVGGSDEMFDLNGHTHEFVEGPGILDGVEGAYAVYMRGDSMEPKYSHGQVLFVHPSRPPRANNFVVVQFTDGRAVVKRFIRRDQNEIVLEQLDPAGRYSVPASTVVALHLIVAAHEIH